MLSIRVPSQIRKLADRFKSTQDFSYGALCTLFALHLFGCVSLCEAARTLFWSPSVSSLDEAVKQFSSNRFMRRQRGSILRRFKGGLDPERYCYAIDDVPVEHFGKKIFRIGAFKHGSGFMRGQRILVLALIDKQRGVALPLAYEVLTSTKEKDHKKASDVAVDIIESILKESFPSLPCVFDSWFDGFALMQRLDALGITFIIEAKSSRKIKQNPAPGARWKSWSEIFHPRIRRAVKLSKTENSKDDRRTRYIAERCVLVKKRSKMLKAAVVYNKLSSKEAFAYYVTNDLTMSGANIWEFSRARWHIEEMFRILKQDFSFGKLALSGEAGTAVGVCFPMALLVSFQLETEIWTQRKCTVGSAVKEARDHSLNHLMTDLKKGSKRMTLLTMTSRRKIERNTKKPVNPTADEIKDWKSSAA